MKLAEILDLSVPFYAHRPKEKEERKKETLEAHSELCLSFYERILTAKKLQPLFRNLWKCYLASENETVEGFFEKALQYAVFFHDTGKINPEFQRARMHNKIAERPCSFLSGADHALFSSVVYLDFCLQQMEQQGFSKKEQKMIKGMLLLNAYVISRHHSDLSNFNEFASSFNEGPAEDIVAGLSREKMKGYAGLQYLSEENVPLCQSFLKKAMKGSSRKQEIGIFAYTRLLYSLLVAADYYATTQYMEGVKIKDFGDFDQIDLLKTDFETADLTQMIRQYEKEQYGRNFDFSSNINTLRSELFLDVESTWKEKKDTSVYFLEAPTGSGKSNTAMNLGFQMLDEKRRKLFYIYPFNTLVEQNLDVLKKTFRDADTMLEKIAVINSITPIKAGEGDIDTKVFYQTALLNRQFLNYPFILTTHVSLFRTMFGARRDDVFSFMQLANSVMILDEIQSYKNTIWSEIIIFIKALAELLNIKVVIMSATLPDLSYLTDETEGTAVLVENREKYFSHPMFKDRVNISYELLGKEVDFQALFSHIKAQLKEPKKILIEFIKKKSAYAFYKFLNETNDLGIRFFLITGDDNQAERKQILEQMRHSEGEGVILVATQVIEAGVDIDMDVGYKDISKLDSEEQFLGRINRSCRRSGTTFFFDLDSADNIYKADIRKNHEFTLKTPEMQQILKNKCFSDYYGPVLQRLKEQINDSYNEDESLESFFKQSVETLQFPAIEKRMRLIDDAEQKISVFFNRHIELEDGRLLEGETCWQTYKTLLEDQKMDYSEKQYHLSQVRSQMSYFIYEISKYADFLPNDRIGELFYIEEGEAYFTDGKLDLDKLMTSGGLFI